MQYRAGDACDIDESATVGYPHAPEASPTVLGDRARVRAGTTLYTDIVVGNDFTTGHDALVREWTRIGDGVVLGTKAVIDGYSTLGSDVSIQTGVYIPTHTTIHDNVFLGPNATLTNDPHPVRRETDLEGPTLQDGVSIGANATILPEVTVGEDAFVAAGAVVTEDVPPRTLAVGIPAEHRPLPEPLDEVNSIA